MGWGKQWSKPWSVVDTTDKLETPFCFGKVTCKVVLLLFSHPVMSDCDPRGFSKPGLPVSHCLLKFARSCPLHQWSAISHLILWHPLLLLPSILPSIRDFCNESAVCIRWPKYWSFSFCISPSYEYSGLISFKIDWFDLLAVQGLSQESSLAPQFEGISSWCSDFFIVQLS